MGENVPTITDVRYNRMKGYSWNYTIGYTGNTPNKHGHTQCDYLRFFVLGFFFYFK
jgi:hypothetical protein